VRDKEKEMLMGDEAGESMFAASAPTQSSDKELQAFREGISGIDVDKGLARFGNDMESYLTVLNSYVKNTPALLDAAVEAGKDKTRLTEYETIVHGVKGSSGAIFANEITEMAVALESAAKSGDYDHIVTNNTAFIKAARELISAIKTVLEENRKTNQKPIKEKPDAAMLEKLSKACEEFDMNGVDEALMELEAFDYESGGELVEWLRESAEQANLDEIVERLKIVG
jgi:chemotaxis protein histidine kinase CheA